MMMTPMMDSVNVASRDTGSPASRPAEADILDGSDSQALPAAPAPADFASLLSELPTAPTVPVVPDVPVAVVETPAGQEQPGVEKEETTEAAATAAPLAAMPWMSLLAMQPPLVPPQAAEPKPVAVADDGLSTVSVAVALPQGLTDRSVAQGMPAVANDTVAVATPDAVGATKPQAALDAAGLATLANSADNRGNDSPDSLANRLMTPLQVVGQRAPAPQHTTEWAPLSLPAATPARWAPTLAATLGERLTVQADHAIQNAVIRLDPPMLGSVEIAIRHEAGSLVVQLTASNSDVVRQLQTVSDTLRNDLMQRQFTDVSVSVGQQGSGDGRQSGRQSADEAEASLQRIARADDAPSQDGSRDGAWLVRV